MAALSAYPYVDRPDDELAFLVPGGFERGKNRIQGWVLPQSEHPPAAGRYHLFLNYACGWSHQCLIARALKGLHDAISVSHTYQRKRLLSPEPTGNGFETLRDVYNSNCPEYGDTQVTVPVLFDCVAKRVVSNDPAHILLMLNEAFDAFATNPTLNLYPPGQRVEIEDVNATVWPGVNDSFYRCFIAKDNTVWAAAYRALVAALEFVDGRLRQHPFLCGEHVTLADVRILPHLLRFELVYQLWVLVYGLRAVDGVPPVPCILSPATVSYMRRVYELPGVAATCDPHLALHGYYNGLGSFAPMLLARRAEFGRAIAAVLRALWRRSVHGQRALFAECDAMYDERRYEWMPTISELEKKRVAESLPATAAEHALFG